MSWYTKSFETGINRSLKPIELSRIINESKFNFVNLQYGEYQEQIREIQQLTNGALFTYSNIDLTNDFENLSNLILECDIVLTIDNTLAGTVMNPLLSNQVAVIELSAVSVAVIEVLVAALSISACVI